MQRNIAGRHLHPSDWTLFVTSDWAFLSSWHWIIYVPPREDTAYPVDLDNICPLRTGHRLLLVPPFGYYLFRQRIHCLPHRIGHCLLLVPQAWIIYISPDRTSIVPPFGYCMSPQDRALFFPPAWILFVHHTGDIDCPVVPDIICRTGLDIFSLLDWVIYAPSDWTYFSSWYWVIYVPPRIGAVCSGMGGLRFS